MQKPKTTLEELQELCKLLGIDPDDSVMECINSLRYGVQHLQLNNEALEREKGYLEKVLADTDDVEGDELDCSERCENCGRAATTCDSEGIPLCSRCAKHLEAEENYAEEEEDEGDGEEDGYEGEEEEDP